MDPDMAGSTQGHQPARIVDPFAPMMDMERAAGLPCPTPAATGMIPCNDSVSMTGESGPIAGELVVADLAESDHRRTRGSAASAE
jgi:hypothetical protein